MTRPVILRLPWFTLYGLPDRPGRWARLRCVAAMAVHEAVELSAGSTRAHAMHAAARYQIGLPPSVVVPASQRNKLYVTTVAHGFPNISGSLVDSRSGVELRVYASGAVDGSYESIVNAGALVEVRLSNSYTGEWEPVGTNATAYFVPGQRYGPPGVLSGGTRVVTSGQATATPFSIEKAVTVDGLGVDLSAAAALGLVFDLHLCAIDATGHPTTPVFSVSVTTIGTTAQALFNTATPVALTSGLYFGVVHNRSAQTVTPRCASPACHLPPIPHSALTSANQFSCWLATVGTGTLTSFPVVASSVASNQGPIVTLRVA
jgi:hypothetical protein